MAWVVDVTQGTISNYETGRSEVPLSILIAMCELLRLAPSELFDAIEASMAPESDLVNPRPVAAHLSNSS